MSAPLAGKTAVVTGIGTETADAVALALAQAGAGLVLCGLAPDLVERAAARLRPLGTPLTTLTLDLSREADAARLAGAAGAVDVLVLISAVWGGGLIHEHRVDTWERVMAANLRAPFLTLRALLPGMRERRSGHIVVFSSDSALGAYERDGAYGVSMHALNALAAAVRVENEAHGIRVDTLVSGLALSDGNPAALQANDLAEWALWLITRRPALTTQAPLVIGANGPG